MLSLVVADWTHNNATASLYIALYVALCGVQLQLVGSVRLVR